jgi:hypothetical protein
MRGARSSVTTDVRYNRLNVYSRKYTTGYIAIAPNSHRNKQCGYMKVLLAVLFFKLNIHNCTQPDFVRYGGLLCSVHGSPSNNGCSYPAEPCTSCSYLRLLILCLAVARRGSRRPCLRNIRLYTMSLQRNGAENPVFTVI